MLITYWSKCYHFLFTDVGVINTNVTRSNTINQRPMIVIQVRYRCKNMLTYESIFCNAWPVVFGCGLGHWQLLSPECLGSIFLFVNKYIWLTYSRLSYEKIQEINGNLFKTHADYQHVVGSRFLNIPSWSRSDIALTSGKVVML